MAAGKAQPALAALVVDIMEAIIHKTASAAMSLRCNAFITVMEAAHLWDCDDPADAGDLPRKWTLLGESQMGSGPMVVTEIGS